MAYLGRLLRDACEHEAASLDALSAELWRRGHPRIDRALVECVWRTCHLPELFGAWLEGYADAIFARPNAETGRVEYPGGRRFRCSWGPADFVLFVTEQRPSGNGVPVLRIECAWTPGTPGLASELDYVLTRVDGAEVRIPTQKPLEWVFRALEGGEHPEHVVLPRQIELTDEGES